MSRMPLLLLVLLACALGFTACGGDDDEDVTQLLAQTFGGGGEDVKSGRLDLNVRLNAQGVAELQGPVALRLAGPFASTKPSELPRFDFNLSLSAQGQDIRAGAVSTGDKGFLRFQDQAYDIGEDLFKQFRDGYAEQARCAEEQDDGGGVSFRTLGVDPRRWLRDPRKEGEEEVGGADTVHIASGIDVPRFLEDINRVLSRTDVQQRQEDPCAEQTGENRPEQQPRRQLSEQERRQIADAIKDARVDVWTGQDDKIMRRLNVTLRFEVPEERRSNARGLESGDVRFDMTLGAVNEDQRIDAPADAQPLEQLTARFGGQVPGLGGASGGASGGSGGGGGASGGAQAPSGEQSSEYVQCVNEAGEDLAKLQACADKIGS